MVNFCVSTIIFLKLVALAYTCLDILNASNRTRLPEESRKFTIAKISHGDTYLFGD